MVYRGRPGEDPAMGGAPRGRIVVFCHLETQRWEAPLEGDFYFFLSPGNTHLVYSFCSRAAVIDTLTPVGLARCLKRVTIQEDRKGRHELFNVVKALFSVAYMYRDGKYIQDVVRQRQVWDKPTDIVAPPGTSAPVVFMV